MCCACDPSERLDAPSICFVCVFVFWKLPPHLGVMMFLYVILYTMHLALWYVVIACNQYDVCDNYVGSMYIGGYGGPSESVLCVFRKLCPVSFHVVGECPSVLLKSVVMSYADCGEDGYYVS